MNIAPLDAMKAQYWKSEYKKLKYHYDKLQAELLEAKKHKERVARLEKFNLDLANESNARREEIDRLSATIRDLQKQLSRAQNDK